METYEKHSPKWLLNKVRENNDTHALMYIVAYSKALIEEVQASESNDIHNVSESFCCGQNRVYNEPKCSKQCDDCYSEYNDR